MQQPTWHTPVTMQYQNNIRNKIVGYDLLFEMMVEILLTRKAPERILVVGAGGGQELVTLGKAYPEANYVAVDYSEPMLELAKNQLTQLEVPLFVEWNHMELQELKQHAPFDVATCHLMLHFLKSNQEKRQLIEQIYHRLSQHGICFFSSINGNPDSEEFSASMKYWQQSMRLKGLSTQEVENFAQSFGQTTFAMMREQFIALLKEAGFKMVLPYYKSYLVDGFVVIKEE